MNKFKDIEKMIKEKYKNNIIIINLKYQNCYSKGTFKCNKCKKIFKQTVRNLLKGFGCYRCSEKRGEVRDTEDFIWKAKKVQGNIYDYSKSIYKNCKTKLVIICKKHGEFLQKPYHHLQGSGCPKCKNIVISNKLKSNTTKFIEKANKIHNNKYNYDQVNYINSSEKIIIICEKHGRFLQIPSGHLQGKGCPKCKNIIISNKLKLNTKEFIKRANKIHNHIYDYSKVTYIGNTNKVIIICKKHGEFLQTPGSHLNGHGCPKCKSSKGEKEVRRVLKKYGIKFKEQYRIKECRDKRPLPFDFYIPKYNLCIEYDGELHYQKWHKSNTSQLKLEKTQYHDKIKTDYCKQNNIKLLRIPYWEKDNIETIICEELKKF